MTHKTPISFTIENKDDAEIIKADLSNPESLQSACQGMDCIVHFAGVLFAPQPEKFLPVTNLGYFKNLLDTAIAEKVGKVILISFPHVEGPTSPENPAKGILDGKPVSVHAQTRLEEEKYLFEKCKNTSTTPVSLRPGMIYGKNILMVDAGKWLAKHHLLAVWKKPTWYHLISIDDFNEAVRLAVLKDNVFGIYNLGDDEPITIQEFADKATKYWDYSKPWRLPELCIYLAARIVELYAKIFRTKSPLTKDFIKIGMVSFTGDTTRMKKELGLKLKYPAFSKGIQIL